MLETALLPQSFKPRPPFFPAFPRNGGEVGIGRVFCGYIESRERILNFLEFYPAALGDVPGAIERVLGFPEQLHHLGPALDVELGRRKAHPVRIGHRLPRLDAKQDLVRPYVIVRQVMRVVGSDQRNTCVSRESLDLAHDDPILVKAMVLQFEEEVLFPEHVHVLVRKSLRFAVALRQDFLVDIAPQARGRCDESL